MSGDRPLVLSMAREGETSDRRVRLFVAALVAPASVVLLSEPTTVRVTVGVAGLVASAAYVAMARGVKRSEDDERLTLDALGVTLHLSAEERSVRWTDVEGFDVGEDASTLLVLVREERPLAIAPGFGGLGTTALHALLVRHRDGANLGDRG